MGYKGLKAPTRRQPVLKDGLATERRRFCHARWAATTLATFRFAVKVPREITYSAYSDHFLKQLAQTLRLSGRRATVWVIFDNTAGGAAIENALTLLEGIE